MGLAIAALVALGASDLLILLGISRMPKLDSFTFAECITIPISLFLLCGLILRAAGFDIVAWPIRASCYTCMAILIFALIAFRKNGIQQWAQTVKTSFITALLFSAIHCSLSGLLGLIIGS